MSVVTSLNQNKRVKMVQVIEEHPKPVEQVRCHNCGSLLEYGNADIHLKYVNEMVNWNTVQSRGHYIWCPVCGCEVPAHIIARKEENNG